MISRQDGHQISYIESIRQSIADILTTAIGSRVMRRHYGSLLPELIDQPVSDALILQCYSAIYTALFIWEDRIIIDSISIEQTSQGVLLVNLSAVLSDSGQAVNLGVNINI